MDMNVRENQLSSIIYDCCYDIHSKLGPGLFESVYERILAYELRKHRLTVSRQTVLPVVWDGHSIDNAFKADLVVEGLVLIELKSVDEVAKIHFKQLHTYLKVTGLRLGILANFGGEKMKEGLTRVVNGLPD